MLVVTMALVLVTIAMVPGGGVWLILLDIVILLIRGALSLGKCLELRGRDGVGQQALMAALLARSGPGKHFWKQMPVSLNA